MNIVAEIRAGKREEGLAEPNGIGVQLVQLAGDVGLREGREGQPPQLQPFRPRELP